MAQRIEIPREPSRHVARQHYLDNLRTFLTICVILSHTAIAYGGPGRWLYKSQIHGPSVVLLAFNAIVSSFNLGGFFFLSGYFSSRSVARKSPYDFVVDKLVRLGIPTVVYTFFIAPLPGIMLRLFLSADGDEDAVVEMTFGTVYQMLKHHVKSVRGVQGPPWYCATLLLLDVFSVYLRNFTISTSPNTRKTIQQRVNPNDILRSIAAVISISFFLRLYFPPTYRFAPLNLRVGLLPQWAAAYILGRQISSPSDVIQSFYLLRKQLITISLASAAVLATLLVAPSSGYSLPMYAGGFNVLAALYEVWNETTGFVLGAGLLVFFETCLDWSWGGLGRCSYGAFLMHPPVCVAFMVLFDGWMVNGVWKTVVVGTLSVASSWAVAWLALKVPGVGQVI